MGIGEREKWQENGWGAGDMCERLFFKWIGIGSGQACGHMGCLVLVWSSRASNSSEKTDGFFR